MTKTNHGRIGRMIAAALVALVALGPSAWGAAFAAEQVDADLDGALGPVAEPAPASASGSNNGLEVQVALDTVTCATGAVQCGLTGHSAAAASSANHNPIRVVALVTLNGAPVGGLTDANIGFSTSFVPAGGAGAVKLSCASCFQAVGGAYGFFVHPTGTGNWKAGHYYAQVSVSGVAAGAGTALVDWEIV